MNLAADYFRQEEAANAKYKGQVVDIEGLVTEVGLTAEEVPYVGMTGMSWLLVQCIFPEDWTEGPPNCQWRRDIRPWGGAKVYQSVVGVQRKCPPATSVVRSP